MSHDQTIVCLSVVSLNSGLLSSLDISAHLDHTAGDLVAAGLEADLHEPPEPRGVVIADRLGVAESFKDGVGLEDLLLDPGRDVGRHAEIKTIQLFLSLGRTLGHDTLPVRHNNLHSLEAPGVPSKHNTERRELTPGLGEWQIS